MYSCEIREPPTPIQADIEGAGGSQPLDTLDRVLDRLHTTVRDSAPERIEAPARGYVEDAIEAAMAAAGRARDNDLEAAAAASIVDPAAVARELLAALRESTGRSEALVNWSLELRRQAMRLTATALTLRRQGTAVRRSPDTRDATDSLFGVRVLVLGDTPGLVEKFTMLLSALGADVRAVGTLGEAIREARAFDADALLCELPADADLANAVAEELSRRGLGLPAVGMMTDTAGAAEGGDGRRAGFVDVLAGPVTFSRVAESIRHAIGR